MKYQYLTEITIINDRLADPNSLESYLKRVLIDSDVTRQKRQEAVDLLANKGWTRRLFYDHCVFLNAYKNLSEHQENLICEFIDDLSEYRSVDSIVEVMIAGETHKDKADFMNFVYSDKSPLI